MLEAIHYFVFNIMVYIEEKSLPTMFLCLRATEEGKKEKEKKVEYRSQSAHSPL